MGAAIEADEGVLLEAASGAQRPVVLAGAPPLVDAWAEVLGERGLRPLVLGQDEREAAFRGGCRAVLEEGRLEKLGDGLTWSPPG